MTVPIQKLECSTGCQMDRIKFLAEQQFLDMNDILNNLQTEHIELCNILEYRLIPVLMDYANSGDLEARDLLIDLNTFL